MRGVGVGVGDIGKVLGRSRIEGHVAGGDDGWAPWRQFESSVVCGRRRIECVTELESSRDGVSVNDVARSKCWACLVYRNGEQGADWM
jgi:hypothetical protein